MSTTTKKTKREVEVEVEGEPSGSESVAKRWVKIDPERWESIMRESGGKVGSGSDIKEYLAVSGGSGDGSAGGEGGLKNLVVGGSAGHGDGVDGVREGVRWNGGGGWVGGGNIWKRDVNGDGDEVDGSDASTSSPSSSSASTSSSSDPPNVDSLPDPDFASDSDSSSPSPFTENDRQPIAAEQPPRPSYNSIPKASPASSPYDSHLSNLPTATPHPSIPSISSIPTPSSSSNPTLAAQSQSPSPTEPPTTTRRRSSLDFSSSLSSLLLRPLPSNHNNNPLIASPPPPAPAAFASELSSILDLLDPSSSSFSPDSNTNPDSDRHIAAPGFRTTDEREWNVVKGLLGSLHDEDLVALHGILRDRLRVAIQGGDGRITSSSPSSSSSQAGCEGEVEVEGGRVESVEDKILLEFGSGSFDGISEVDSETTAGDTIPTWDPLPPATFRTQRNPRVVLGGDVLGKRSTSWDMVRRQAAQGDGQPSGNAGFPSCDHVSNAVLSCFPNATTTLVQDNWSKFIWNSNYPTFIGAGAVDIYLYHADSETIATTYLNISNARGSIGIQPQDVWWPNETSWTNGQNLTFPYFFVIVPTGQALTGGELHQATFSAIQTQAPSTLIAASLSSASVASASSVAASLASVSSMSAMSASLYGTASGSGAGSGSASGSAPRGSASSAASLQNASDNGGGFPHWAIAVITVLGFLALLLFMLGCYFFFRWLRRERERERREANYSDGGNSLGSNFPIMAASAVGTDGGRGVGSVDAPRNGMMGEKSGLLLGAGLAGAGVGAAAGAGLSGSEKRGSGTSSSGYDSHPGFAEGGQLLKSGAPGSSRSSREGGITGADAAIMADAFRKALRKPEFPSGDPSPGESSVAESNRAGGNAGGAGGAGGEGEGDRGEGGVGGGFLTVGGGGAGGSKPREERRESAILGRQKFVGGSDTAESGDDYGDDRSFDVEEPEEARDLMEKELASEGRSVRSVGGRRKAQVVDE